MEVSAYVWEDATCLTAKGVSAEGGIVAATGLEMAQKIEIEGLLGSYVVADTGPLRADQIDVFMLDRADAKEFGRHNRLVTIYREGEE